MNLNDLPSHIRFLFLTLGQAAIQANDSDIGKNQFLEFCQHVWDTMELNGVKNFSDTLNQLMITDIAKKKGGLDILSALKDSLDE